MQYYEHAKAAFAQAYPEVTKPLEHELAVKLTFHWFRVRRSDTDNYAKHVLDSFNDLVWKDDSLIFKLTLLKKKALTQEHEKTEIEIKKYIP